MLKHLKAPVAPSQLEYLDEDGYVDYEAWDDVMDKWVATFNAWYDEHGYIIEQCDVMWSRREAQLAVAR